MCNDFQDDDMRMSEKSEGTKPDNCQDDNLYGVIYVRPKCSGLGEKTRCSGLGEKTRCSGPVVLVQQFNVRKPHKSYPFFINQ